MGKVGRPRKNPDELVSNQLIAIDAKDYERIKIKSIESGKSIKEIIKDMVTVSIDNDIVV